MKKQTARDSWDRHSLSELEPHTMLDLLRPRHSYFTMRRFGGEGDGAYVLPDIDGGSIGSIGSVFSAGVGNRKEFEDELLQLYGARSYLLDRSSSETTLRTPLGAGQTLERKWLAAVSGPESISLRDWVAAHTAETERDLVLSVDIEGAEWEALSSAPIGLLDRFALIVIELHGLKDFGSPDLYRRKIRPMLTTLFHHHSSVHVSPNNCCGTVMLPSLGIALPKTLELTLVHNRLLPREPLARSTPAFPHELDINQNQKSKPPLFLVGSFWDQSNTEKSRAKRRELIAESESCGVTWDSRRLLDDLGDLFSSVKLGGLLPGFDAFKLRSVRPVRLEMLGLQIRPSSGRSLNRRAIFVLYLDCQRLFPRVRLAWLTSHWTKADLPRNFAKIRPTEVTQILVVAVGLGSVSVEAIEALGR